MLASCPSTPPVGRTGPRAHREVASRHWFFLADWVNVLMIHFEVDAAALQQATPFPLDLYEGRAFVSTVAFTMRRMRPYASGAWTERWFRPIATHAFLNVRTYVQVRGETGICFLAEWIPNRLSYWLGGPLFGLPYRLGRLEYQQDFSRSIQAFRGTVTDARTSRAFRYRGAIEHTSCPYGPCQPGSLEEWLMERYAAFTYRKGVARRFHVEHAPWQQIPTGIEIEEASLLTRSWPWFGHSQLVGANASPGFCDVRMERPGKFTNG
jgi:uncharacterized protein YqjF (DUF2071 family)